MKRSIWSWAKRNGRFSSRVRNEWDKFWACCRRRNNNKETTRKSQSLPNAAEKICHRRVSSSANECSNNPSWPLRVHRADPTRNHRPIFAIFYENHHRNRRSFSQSSLSMVVVVPRVVTRVVRLVWPRRRACFRIESEVQFRSVKSRRRHRCCNRLHRLVWWVLWWTAHLQIVSICTCAIDKQPCSTAQLLRQGPIDVYSNKMKMIIPNPKVIFHVLFIFSLKLCSCNQKFPIYINIFIFYFIHF